MYFVNKKNADYLCCMFQVICPAQTASYYFHDIDFGQNYLARNWAYKIMLPSGTVRTKCEEPRITSQMMVLLPRISYYVSRWPHMLDMVLSDWACIAQSKQIICGRTQWILKVFSRVEEHYHLETWANHFIFSGCFLIHKIKLD